MEHFGNWIIPITFIPGVGMLILSTSNRFGQLNGEINQLLSGNLKLDNMMLEYQIRRSHLFSNTLICLYIGVTSFSLGSLVGGVLTFYWSKFAQWFLISSICLGVGCVVGAATLLIIESAIASKVVRTRCINSIKE